MNVRRTFSAVVILMVVSGPSLYAQSPIGLLRTGSFHGDEVAADSGGPWFALIFDSAGAYLQRVQVSITLERDPLHDHQGEGSGKAVAITPSAENVVLLRGIATLGPGRVPTSLMDQRIGLGQTVAARVGTRRYSFTLQCDGPTQSGGVLQECHLELTDGEAKERLFTYRAYSAAEQLQWASERAPMVIWAGDIDGDGRLDALLDTSTTSNGEDFTLYLSSSAATGQLVKPVASFGSVGC